MLGGQLLFYDTTALGAQVATPSSSILFPESWGASQACSHHPPATDTADQGIPTPLPIFASPHTASPRQHPWEPLQRLRAFSK